MSPQFYLVQRRNMHVPELQAFQILANHGIPISHGSLFCLNNGLPVSSMEDSKARDYFLTITIDRKNCTPCIITSHSIGGESPQIHACSYPLIFKQHVDGPTMRNIARDLDFNIDSANPIEGIIHKLVHVFLEKEASSLSTRLSRSLQGEFEVARAILAFDDAAHRSKRHKDIQKMRNTEYEVAEEVEAEKDGIVYIK